MRKIRGNFILMTVGLLTLAPLFVTACQKEEEIKGMRLVAEGFGLGNKAAVEDNAVYWVEGETLRINGVDKVVQVSGSQAYVVDVADPADDIYRALYPNSLNASADLTDNDVTVAIPRVYVYRVSNGRQALDLPMAAYGSASGGSLMFKHLTAAITVQVVNNFGIDIMVDSIVVVSNSYQISGSRSITLGNDIAVEPNGSPALANDKKVVVRFNGGTSLTVASGETARVQVPVLPVGEDNKFTITVATHNVDEPLMQYTFSRTQGTGGALARRQMAYAPASFGGVFTVSAGGDKVRFAPGNLQYYCSTSAPQWRFALHQYDNATFNIDNYKSNTGQWIDLFGFATSGYNNKNPYYKSTTLSYYSPASGTNDIKETEYDWGWHNTIVNGGNTNHLWHVLSASEWNYLIVNRSTKIGIASVRKLNTVPVTTIHGLVILPDDWNNPLNRSFVSGVGMFSQNSYTEEEWAKMEVAGAVFLPSNGYRTPGERASEGYGYYWSEQFNRSDNLASYITFNTSAISSVTPGYTICRGLSVRLVRDVE